MTTGTAQNAQQVAVRTQQAERGVSGARLTPLDWTVLGVLGASFFALFFRWFDMQLGGFSYKHVEDWGHAYVVPLISGYFVWKHRDDLARLPIRVYWPGAVVLLASIVLYFYFIAAYSNHMFQGFAMVMAIAGLTLLLAGPRMFQALLFPIAYLGFMVTISEMVMNKITWQLKLLASKGSWLTLSLFGVDCDLRGNVITIFPANSEPVPLNVADACSGMRMVVAFIALAVAVAFFSCDRWWQRIAVMLLAVPVALLMNIVRVAVLGALALYDPGLSVGESHTLIGTLLLVPAFGMFMGCVWLLKQIVRNEPGATPKGVAP